MDRKQFITGLIALGAARKYTDLASVADSEMLVVLDGVEDPHNLGAVIRTALAAERTAWSSRNGARRA